MTPTTLTDCDSWADVEAFVRLLLPSDSVAEIIWQYQQDGGYIPCKITSWLERVNAVRVGLDKKQVKP